MVAGKTKLAKQLPTGLKDAIKMQKTKLGELSFSLDYSSMTDGPTWEISSAVE